jgi:hypothetical protein
MGQLTKWEHEISSFPKPTIKSKDFDGLIIKILKVFIKELANSFY